MPSQTDLYGRGIDYDVDDAEEDKGGELKTENQYPGQPQRLTFAQGKPGSAFRSNVTLATCVHGYLNPSKTKRASLIIIQYDLSYAAGKRVYNSVDTSVKFRAEGTTPPNDHPQVVEWAPFLRPGEIDRTVIEYENTIHRDATAGIDMGPMAPAKVEASVGREVKSTIPKAYSIYCEAHPNWNNDIQGWDAVEWSMHKDRMLTGGIPPTIKVAMVVARGNDARFSGKFKLKQSAEPLADLGQSLLRTFGLGEKIDPIYFDPGLPPHGLPKGIKIDGLGELKGEKLRQLTAVLKPESLD